MFKYLYHHSTINCGCTTQGCRLKQTRKGLRRSGFPHLTVAMENEIKTLAPPVFPSKIVYGEYITPPVLKFCNHSFNMVLHVYSAVFFLSMEWVNLLHPAWLCPPFSSVFTSHEGTLSLTHTDKLETDVQQREAAERKKSDIMFLLKRLAITCTSLYSCVREILGSLLNQVTKPSVDLQTVASL